MTHTLDDIIGSLSRGELVILVDDVGSPLSAHLLCTASLIRPESVAFMANEARGVTCIALSEDRIRELELPMMVPETDDECPDFTVSIEAREGVTTGISAADRARTLRTAAETKKPKLDLVTPGHIFPLRAKRGGVLVRDTAAEAAVDLLELAGLPQAGAICRCLDDDGRFAGERRIRQLETKFGLSTISISQIIRHRLSSEPIIELIAEAKLPTKHAGVFRAFCFRTTTDGAEHLALVKGSIEENAGSETTPLLVRVQAESRITDLFGVAENPSRQKLYAALKRIDEAGCGVFVYVRQPHQRAAQLRRRESRSTRGEHQQASYFREYGIGAQILSFLGVHRIQLMTNSEGAISGIAAFGLEIVNRVSLPLAEKI